MKRTINEIYKLIEEKRENAGNDYERALNKEDKEEADILKGEIRAYFDVMLLIKTSGVLDNDK